MPRRPPIDPAGFVQLVAAAFPDLRAELDEDDGLEYVRTGTFCEHTQAAIDRGDMGVVDTCFGIADSEELLKGSKEEWTRMGPPK